MRLPPTCLPPNPPPRPSPPLPRGRRARRSVLALLAGLAAGARLLAAAPAAGADTPQPINLESALRLAGAQNLALALARERVREARARQDEDRQALYPWLAPGLGYRRHDGNLQDIVGDVFNASKQSGTAALGLVAQVEPGEALYRSLASRQLVRAAEAGEAAERRLALSRAAAAYLELCRAAAAVDATDEATRLAADLHRQVQGAVSAGLAFAGEIPRAALEAERSRNFALQAREQVRLASARLAQILHLPPALELRPDLAEFVPVLLVETHRSLDSLVAAALQSRPELHQSDARLLAARDRRRGVTTGPWIPTLGAGITAGGLVGGRNDAFGRGDDFQDYTLGLSWRIGPGGLGDRARVRSADSRVRLAELEREQAREDITREVVEAHVRTGTLAGRLDLAGRALAEARKLWDLTRARREFGAGAVLEAVEAERELTRTRLEHLATLADHNRAQWELWRVAGPGEPPAPRKP